MISALAYSPDGTVLAVAGCREILIHGGDGPEGADSATGSTPQKRLGGLSQRIESLAELVRVLNAENWEL